MTLIFFRLVLIVSLVLSHHARRGNWASLRHQPASRGRGSMSAPTPQFLGDTSCSKYSLQVNTPKYHSTKTFKRCALYIDSQSRCPVLQVHAQEGPSCWFTSDVSNYSHCRRMIWLVAFMANSGSGSMNLLLEGQGSGHTNRLVPNGWHPS